MTIPRRRAGSRVPPERGTRPLLSVLFLCTGTSARSILAEALLNHAGDERIRGYSAGSRPRGEVHPIALALLRDIGASVTGLRSKHWDEFAAQLRRDS
jgi:arsenate reductase